MLYTHATIITVDQTRRVISDGALLVHDDKIVDVGKTTELTTKYPEEAQYDLSNHIVMPGMVSTHMHCVQSILRGIAEDRDLISWMCDRIWVAQGNITPPEAYAAARLSMAEMLKGGTTCFIESLWAERYGFDGLVKAVDESGIRGCLGKVVMDRRADQPEFRNRMHHGLVEDRQSLANAVQMHDKWHGSSDGRVQVWFGARTPGGVTTELLTEMSSIAREKGIRITMHCLEEKADRDVFDQDFKKGPMQYCEEIGLLGDRTVLIHMVWLEDDDIHRLATTRTHIAHCPSSNMKLGSGFCPVPKLLDNNVNVGIGCDGAPCSNTLDLFQEMSLAAKLQKGLHLNPKLLPAETMIEMATIKGAEAVGLVDKIGSLEIGKQADFIGIKVENLHQVPTYDPVSTVVHATNARDVKLVVVNGKVTVENGQLTTMDEAEVIREGIKAGKAVLSRANLADDIHGSWPLE
ncbi:hypothetical protein A1O3_03252 [Capronia epimyces CBS 606.96]|uniref:Uncharacterized protein n=1 Tax=Capronia epimyces CBS 606.96 TaxID=1182542 RepID=W9YAK4_9EURO|nr:uncharacterized protein A1O3_03252 [Capronia epimyces CBS 606.96]EXJ86301.1 hypothetical protein A1O3_03252 [Capronia epimyces CBS 606.96]